MHRRAFSARPIAQPLKGSLELGTILQFPITALRGSTQPAGGQARCPGRRPAQQLRPSCQMASGVTASATCNWFPQRDRSLCTLTKAHSTIYLSRSGLPSNAALVPQDPAASDDPTSNRFTGGLISRPQLRGISLQLAHKVCSFVFRRLRNTETNQQTRGRNAPGSQTSGTSARGS